MDPKQNPWVQTLILVTLKKCLSYIPVGYSCLYIAPEGTCLDQLPPKEKGGLLTQLAQSYETVVAFRIGKNKYKYRVPDKVDHVSHVPVLLTKEDLERLKDKCTVEDIGGHKVSGYTYPPIVEKRTMPHMDPDEITQALT